VFGGGEDGGESESIKRARIMSRSVKRNVHSTAMKLFLH
jgi:hypothetical protein